MTPLRMHGAPDRAVVPGSLPTAFACSGCDYRLPPDEPVRLGCPAARPGDDVDHVLRRVLDPARLTFPGTRDPNPFVRYRTLFHGYHQARAEGWSDGDVIRLIHRLDRDVAAVEGHGFVVTPFSRADALSAELGFDGRGGVWVKDETGNVAGSHKARHLFGTLLEIELAGNGATSSLHLLAIASCGNAALAAAVVARAAGRHLQVFIPEGADAGTVERLTELGAEVSACARGAAGRGDPAYNRLLEAIADGAIPFTCQGNLNALAIEAGATLGWELVTDLVTSDQPLEHVVIQVGGGALASSVVQGFTDARALGAVSRLPRFHTVQTRAAFPLARAHQRLSARIAPAGDPRAVERELAWAARHRSEFMWAWETEPRSVAGGILDDETYDWLAVVAGMLRTGGTPAIVDDDSLRRANRLARATTGIDVDATGSAGLAGALELLRSGVIGPGENVAVIFSGIRRGPDMNGVQS